MRVFIKKNLIHMLIIIATVVYFFVSPIVQQKMSLQASMLTVVSDSLLPVTQDARMSVDYLRMTNTSKSEYELAGWGFCHSISCTDPSDYSRKILLVSDKRAYSIDINPSNRPDVEEAFKYLNLNLKGVGFQVKILKDALPKGKYKIYLYFNLTDGTKWILDSTWSVIRSNNDIELMRTIDAN